MPTTFFDYNALQSSSILCLLDLHRLILQLEGCMDYCSYLNILLNCISHKNLPRYMGYFIPPPILFSKEGLKL